MSSSTYKYIFNCFEDASEMVYDIEIKDLIRDLSKLLRSEEWYKSGETTESDYKEDLSSFKTKWFKSDRNERLRIYVDDTLRKVKEDMYGLIGIQC